MSDFAKSWKATGRKPSSDELNVVEMFHGSLDELTREKVPLNFINDHSTSRVLITTVAFGLGMQVCHYELLLILEY